MKNFLMPALAAAFAVTAIAAPVMSTPVMAQVNGTATANLPIAVAQAQALQNGFQQIETQYAAQLTTIEQRQQQRQQLIQTFDTNGDGGLDAAEQAPTQDPNNATVQQIQAIDQEIQTLQQPINLARVFVVSQVAGQYQAALQQVISDNNIQFVLQPDAIIYAPDAANVTAQVVTALNTRFPAAQIIPSAEFQPTEAAVQLYQQIQQIFMIAAMQQQQAAAAAAQQQAPATSGR